MRFLRRLLLGALLLGVAVLCSAIVIDRHVSNTASDFIVRPEEAPSSDAILVLGASVRANGQVSDMLGDRLDTALELYNAKRAPKFLVSGDHGSVDYDETGTMKRYLTEHKVPARNIFMDHAGFSTYESMYRAKHIFDVKKVIIVTQSYHLKRAVYVARSLGIDAYGVAADKSGYQNMEKFKAREFLARNKDFVYARILRPKPAILGDKVPITGDGRSTAKP
ncbi:SanA/YdcF family protein [Gorillibacterium sp. sgz5001074]|uniref:SanA/YdcF family protein n=1 Tax=Gorillibacterium sp. sgz5001074 TaxID=3446695 RepID=UPI003F66D608